MSKRHPFGRHAKHAERGTEEYQQALRCLVNLDIGKATILLCNSVQNDGGRPEILWRTKSGPMEYSLLRTSGNAQGYVNVKSFAQM